VFTTPSLKRGDLHANLEYSLTARVAIVVPIPKKTPFLLYTSTSS